MSKGERRSLRGSNVPRIRSTYSRVKNLQFFGKNFKSLYFFVFVSLELDFPNIFGFMHFCSISSLSNGKLQRKTRYVVIWQCARMAPTQVIERWYNGCPVKSTTNYDTKSFGSYLKFLPAIRVIDMYNQWVYLYTHQHFRSSKIVSSQLYRFLILFT